MASPVHEMFTIVDTCKHKDTCCSWYEEVTLTCSRSRSQFCSVSPDQCCPAQWPFHCHRCSHDVSLPYWYTPGRAILMRERGREGGRGRDKGREKGREGEKEGRRERVRDGERREVNWIPSITHTNYTLHVHDVHCRSYQESYSTWKNISGGAMHTSILRSLDSTVSSLLALLSREYAQLVQRTTGIYMEGAPEVIASCRESYCFQQNESCFFKTN